MDKNLFNTGNIITTNNQNCLEIIASNTDEIVCRDLLTDDFCILKKTEHKYELADTRIILELSLHEIIHEVKDEISEKAKQHILQQMGCRIAAWIK